MAIAYRDGSARPRDAVDGSKNITKFLSDRLCSGKYSRTFHNPYSFGAPIDSPRTWHWTVVTNLVNVLIRLSNTNIPKWTYTLKWHALAPWRALEWVWVMRISTCRFEYWTAHLWGGWDVHRQRGAGDRTCWPSSSLENVRRGTSTALTAVGWNLIKYKPKRRAGVAYKHHKS